MYRNAVLLILLHVSLLIHAAKPLTDKAQFSLLIGAPNGVSVFSVFGHAAMRINDPGLNIDYIFNYGVFDGTNVENILQLLKGNLYCELWVYDTEEYLEESRRMGIGLKEHILSFLPEEKETLWQYLIAMGERQHGRYRYDILRTNCATLPLMAIEKAAPGKIIYGDSTALPSGGYDHLAYPYLKPYPWACFLAYLFFGNAIGQPLSFKESLFLPDNLEAAFQSAVIVTGSDSRPLIASTDTMVENTRKNTAPGFFTPSTVGWLLLAAVLVLSLIEWKKKRYFRAIDCTLFGIAGLCGIIIFLLNTVFAEWYTLFNYHLSWLHPLHLSGVVFFAFGKFNKQAYYYHLFNLAALLAGAILLSVFGIEAMLLIVAAPFMLTLGTRSIFGLIRYNKNKK